MSTWGLNKLILQQGSRDFFWKATVQELDHKEVALDIHHIFPKAWCEAKKIKPATFNSIVNKTPISYKANRMIGGRAPSEYLAAIQSHKQVKLSDDGMNTILGSHCSDTKALRTDDFDAFFEARKEALLNLVEQTTGKSIDRVNQGAVPDLDNNEDAAEEEAA
jgi:hypothetical protein